jgi:hypothetical protein
MDRKVYFSRQPIAAFRRVNERDATSRASGRAYRELT